MPRQVVPLPRLAGEQQDLTLFALGQQDIQRGAEPSVIEGYQRVVQNQRGIRGQFFRHSQTKGEVQLVDGAVAAPQRVVEGFLVTDSGMEGEVLAHGKALVAPAGHGGKIGLCPLGNPGGESPL